MSRNTRSLVEPWAKRKARKAAGPKQSKPKAAKVKVETPDLTPDREAAVLQTIYEVWGRDPLVYGFKDDPVDTAAAKCVATMIARYGEAEALKAFKVALSGNMEMSNREFVSTVLGISYRLAKEDGARDPAAKAAAPFDLPALQRALGIRADNASLRRTARRQG